MGQNKPQIWNPRPQFAYSLYNFYKATMTIKGTLLLNNSIVKRSVEKN